MRLRQYLDEHDAEVWLIAGSPERLVERVYRDSAFLPRTVDRQPHHAPLRRLGLDSALPGDAKVVQLGSGSVRRFETLQRLQRQQAG